MFQLVWGEYDEAVVAKLRFSVTLMEMFLQAVEDTECVSGKGCVLERKVSWLPSRNEAQMILHHGN